MDKWDFILEHAEHSRHLKPIPDDWATGEAGNRSCGDYVKIGLKIEDGRVVEARFQHSGCLVSRASASVLSGMVEGKTLEEAGKIRFEDLLERFQGSIQTRLKCARVAYEAMSDLLSKVSDA